MQQINEFDFTPLNAEAYFYSQKFHHSLKGCEIEMRKKECVRNEEETDYCYNKFCLTHNKLCSKTGWELGWYLGTNNLKGLLTLKCFKCGSEFHTNRDNRRYCDQCKIKR